jgi:uncharacterized membrane protein YdjX (TVP38/TMEM64 family)
MTPDDISQESKCAVDDAWTTGHSADRTRSLYLVLLMVLVLGIGVWLWRPTAGLEDVLSVLQRGGPLLFFSALVVLPLVGVPSTPFYLLAGPAFGPGMAMLGTAVALALQQTLAYWLSRHGLRTFIKRLLGRTRFRVPEVKPEHHARFTVLVRITPGLPSWGKNYLVGVAGIPFPTFFWISWPIALAYSAAFILLGDAAFTRDWRELIPVVVLVALLLFLRYRFRLRRQSIQPGTGTD